MLVYNFVIFFLKTYLSVNNKKFELEKKDLFLFIILEIHVNFMKQHLCGRISPFLIEPIK